MRFTSSWVLSVSTLVVLQACSPAAPPAEPDPEEAVQEIQARYDQALSDFSAEDDPEVAAEIYLEFHTEDAVLMFPGGPAIQGHESIRPFIVDFVSGFEFSAPDLTTHEIIVSGDLAVHRFSAVAWTVARAGGDTIRDDRKYLDVLRKGEDGEWRVARHIFNNNR
ncbi:MAG: DUF4440 domain-containing protein [Gemmatimonadetes bacterium]|nr:DUF4440 domain-containing protein [Gemmatimonadota bacterium]